MPLHLTLRPHEKVLIGGAVIQNGGERSELLLLNDVVVLRQKDVLTDDTADTPCKVLYYAVQLMYMDGNDFDRYQSLFSQLSEGVPGELPGALEYIEVISEHVAKGEFYRALKAAKQLVQYEKEFQNRDYESD